MRITKAHVGRTVEFAGCNAGEGLTQSGTVAEVRNGIAVVLCPTAVRHGMYGPVHERTKTGEPFRALLEVADKRLIRIV